MVMSGGGAQRRNMEENNTTDRGRQRKKPKTLKGPETQEGHENSTREIHRGT